MLRGNRLALATIAIVLIFVVSASVVALVPLAPTANHSNAHAQGAVAAHSVGPTAAASHVSSVARIPQPALNGTATFNQSGLPSGTVWSVTFNGTTVSSNGTAKSFHVKNGTYNYTIGAVAGYMATPTSGSVTIVAPGTKFVNIVYTPLAAMYTVTFKETGLANGPAFSGLVFGWSASLNGNYTTASVNHITYTVAAGTYPWKAGAVTYTAFPPSGSLTVTGNTTLTITFTQNVIVVWKTTFPAYSIIPSKGGTDANFSVTVNNSAITPANTTIKVVVSDSVTGATNNIIAIPAVAGKTLYNFTINYTNLGCAASNCQTQPSDALFFAANVTQNNGTGLSPGQATNLLFIVTITPTGQFVSPLPGRAVGTGNVSISAVEFGQFVSTANVTIYSPTNPNAKIFTANVFSVNGVPATTPWTVNLAGVYPMLLRVIAPYHTALIWNNITVIQSGGTIYQNSTSYTNASIIPGLSPALGGTVLLVVGLIIGLVVGTLLARAMVSTKPGAPAQPWTETKPSPNTCSTCGKSFDTEEELKAHQASEHGMSQT